MSTVLTKFELYTTITGDPNVQAAIDACTNGLLALGVNVITFSALVLAPDGSLSSQRASFGLLTSSQATSALALLSTLNTALGTQVLCYTAQVTQQP